MKYEINIGDEFCEEITRLNLIDSLRSIMTNLDSLKQDEKVLRKNGQELPSYKLEDKLYDKKIKKALIKLIQYYSTPDQWHEFQETIQ